MADDARPPVRAVADVASNPVIRLWPDGAPGGLPDLGPEQAFRNVAVGGGQTTMLRNVSDPSLTVFAPEPGRANGVGVIVCPGGGWRILAWEHEGIDLARWLAGRGYTAFLLKYRLRATAPDPDDFARDSAKMAASLPAEVPYAKAPTAIAQLMRDETSVKARVMAADDGRQALKIVRERAGEWGLDPNRIGMTGFSAGAFLAVDVAMEPGGAPLAVKLSRPAREGRKPQVAVIRATRFGIDCAQMGNFQP